jgi:hypothetical protein
MNITDRQLHDEPSLFESVINDLCIGLATIWQEFHRPWGERMTLTLPKLLPGKTYERRGDKH